MCALRALDVCLCLDSLLEGSHVYQPVDLSLFPQYLPDQYFKDGTSKIDFVLVRTCIREDNSDGIDHESRQKTYEENLVRGCYFMREIRTCMPS